MLEKLKRRLGIEDESQDALLQDLLDDASDHFKLLTGADAVDSKYEFIIRDVASARYARKGSEGLESESVDGYSAKYIKGDFEPYLELLDSEFNLSDDFYKKGKVMYW